MSAKLVLTVKDSSRMAKDYSMSMMDKMFHPLKHNKILNSKQNIFAKFSSFCFHKLVFLSCRPASALFFLVKNPVKSSSAAIYPLLSSQAAY